MGTRVVSGEFQGSPHPPAWAETGRALHPPRVCTRASEDRRVVPTWGDGPVDLVPRSGPVLWIPHQQGWCHLSRVLPWSRWACAPSDCPRWTLSPSTPVPLSWWSSGEPGRSPSSLRSTPTSSSSPTAGHSDTRWSPDHLRGCSPTPRMQKQPGKQEPHLHLLLPAAPGGPGRCPGLWHLPRGLTRSLCPLPQGPQIPLPDCFLLPCTVSLAVASRQAPLWGPNCPTQKHLQTPHPVDH